ncbi:MAG TPA: HD-GYP domain-containing protein [Gaiellales bacterium]|jgi:HD-GYP domain-containing protein (c-di-GMP phosphodiesterase class II)|nr:HD-GYP domain-containing protein [Gaiellales bacterium]
MAGPTHASDETTAEETLVEESRSRMHRPPDRREVRVEVATGLALAATLVALGALVPDVGRHPGIPVVVALVVAYGLAFRVQFEVGSGAAVPTQLVLVPMLFAVPLPWVPVLVAAGMALAVVPEVAAGHSHPARLGLNLLNACYAVGPVLVMWAFGQPPAELSARLVLVVTLAVAAQFAVDFAVWVGCGGASRGDLARAVAWAWLVDMALTPLALVLAVADRSDPFAFLVSLPLIALLWRFARERQRHYDRVREFSEAYRGTALLLGDMVEANDSYTGLHSQDVVTLVLAVSDRLGLPRQDRDLAEFTALLHDVGKVNVPKAIINKPGPLTIEERALIETHTIEGERMLVQVGGLLAEVGRLVRSCHERWDGHGYPDGLAGERIPIVARIVCACDAFSAMASHRSYRKARPVEQALAEIARCAGSHFDPQVAAALIEVVREETPALVLAA